MAKLKINFDKKIAEASKIPSRLDSLTSIKVILGNKSLKGKELTIGKFLLLELIDSPFLGNNNQAKDKPENNISFEDLLASLYISDSENSFLKDKFYDSSSVSKIKEDSLEWIDKIEDVNDLAKMKFNLESQLGIFSMMIPQNGSSSNTEREDLGNGRTKTKSSSAKVRNDDSDGLISSIFQKFIKLGYLKDFDYITWEVPINRILFIMRGDMEDSFSLKAKDSINMENSVKKIENLLDDSDIENKISNNKDRK